MNGLPDVNSIDSASSRNDSIQLCGNYSIVASPASRDGAETWLTLAASRCMMWPMLIYLALFRARWHHWVVALGLLLSGVAFLFYQVDTRARSDEVRHADAIIVLGSAVWKGERPSPSLVARTQHAIELYQTGVAAHLIFSGGLGANPPAEAEVMRRIASAAQIPADAMVLEDKSHSTEENLANSKVIMDAHGWRTAIIVSDPFHIYRAETMARDIGLDAYGSGARNSPLNTNVGLRTWYTAREALAMVWYFGTRVFGEPTWLYTYLKEHQQTNN
jgi:uncharacterized SAM-binding protein YcdF (DUF218 family)